MQSSVSTSPPFTDREACEASDTWGFNCGPAALAIVMGLTPEEVRPHLGDFRGYMNPTQMFAALRSIGVEWRLLGLENKFQLEAEGQRFPKFGLARIQWSGPWMAPKVPIPARYSRTHWVASCAERGQKTKIYDVNAFGWMKLSEWTKEIVPRLLADVPRADGLWFVTHAIEVSR